MIVKACVRSGFCCEKSPCPYGEWDSENKRCSFLSYDADGRTKCQKYSEIMEHPEIQKFSPAFGFGCCSGLNSKRTPIIKEHHGGIIPTVEIDDF